MGNGNAGGEKASGRFQREPRAAVRAVRNYGSPLVVPQPAFRQVLLQAKNPPWLGHSRNVKSTQRPNTVIEPGRPSIVRVLLVAGNTPSVLVPRIVTVVGNAHGPQHQEILLAARKCPSGDILDGKQGAAVWIAGGCGTLQYAPASGEPGVPELSPQMLA